VWEVDPGRRERKIAALDHRWSSGAHRKDARHGADYRPDITVEAIRKAMAAAGRR
jgi:hypothetical protein